MTTTFHLIRHGQTDWNIQNRYQGQVDVPLNETGINQARNAAKMLAGQSFNLLYSSDLMRAVQTAEELSKVVDLPIHKDPRLREINQGQWQGLLIDEVLNPKMESISTKVETIESFHPPDGESIIEVADRVWRCLDDLAKIHTHHNIILVSHGMAIATALCKFRGIPLWQTKENIPENCEIVQIKWNY
ncbi:MAG: histidine phosphatase family protein [Anaerolineaceae bacterium]